MMTIVLSPLAILRTFIRIRLLARKAIVASSCDSCRVWFRRVRRTLRGQDWDFLGAKEI